MGATSSPTWCLPQDTSDWSVLCARDKYWSYYLFLRYGVLVVCALSSLIVTLLGGQGLRVLKCLDFFPIYPATLSHSLPHLLKYPRSKIGKNEAYKTISQQAHNLKTTSNQRRCDVMASRRRRYDVVLTSCTCWVSFCG